MQICVHQDAGPRRFAATHCITAGSTRFLVFCLFVCWLTCVFFFFFLISVSCVITVKYWSNLKQRENEWVFLS